MRMVYTVLNHGGELLGHEAGEVEPALGCEVDVLEAVQRDGEARILQVNQEVHWERVVGRFGGGGDASGLGEVELVVNGVELYNM